MKLIKSLVASIVIIVITSNVVFADSNGLNLWTQFRGNVLNPAITDSKTPTTSLEVKEKWSVEVGEGWKFSDPIIVGDYIYATDSSYIKKYNNIHNKNVVKSKKFILHFKNLKWYNKYTACSFDNVSPVVKATFFIKKTV